MESLWSAVTVALAAAAVLTFIALVRETLPHISPEDRTSLRSIGVPTFRRLRLRDRALSKAWNVHSSVFPKSQKRKVFAVLLTAAVLSVFGYPLWLALK